MKKEKDRYIIITAIIAVAALEVVAMCFGHNGHILRIVIGAICLLAGVAVPTEKLKKIIGGLIKNGRK